MLLFKLISLIALSIAPRAQSICALRTDLMSVRKDYVRFVFENILKTSKQGGAYTVYFKHYDREPLCVMHTLLHYIKVTEKLRSSEKLIISHKTFKPVTTSTVARWLREVLCLSGIDVETFKAHSFRGAVASAALRGGCSLRDVLNTADWSSAKNFHKFYFREVANKSFTEAVLDVA